VEAVLSVKELRALSTRLTPAQLAEQLGPFVLVQQPPELAVETPGTRLMGLPASAKRTMVAKVETVSAGALSLLFQFDELVVATLPPLAGDAELTVGRQPDNDLVLDHPSVSKRHATLKWDAANRRCTVVDHGSTNGTLINVNARVKQEMLLKSGDILSFGEVQYWFLLTPMLLEKLRAAPPRGVHV
jgi:hypothetical protein